MKKKKQKPQFENTKTVIDLAKKSTVPNWDDYITKYDTLLTKMAKMQWDETQQKMMIDGQEVTVEPALTKAGPFEYYETENKPNPLFHPNAPAKPHSTTSSKQCPQCLIPMFTIWEEDAYICPHCNTKYTRFFLHKMEKNEFIPPPLHIKDLRDEIQKLKNALHYIQQQNRKLQERLTKMLHQEQQMVSLFLAAKQIAGLAFAGEETPDEEIEKALTALLGAVSNYETNASSINLDAVTFEFTMETYDPDT